MSTVLCRPWKGPSRDMGTNAQSRWIFRVATAARYGGGHLSRCLTLADAMPDTAEVLFHIDPDAEGAAVRIRQHGYAAAMDDGAPVVPVSGVVLDGYEFAPETVARYRSAGRLAIIDDLGHIPNGAALAINTGFQMSGTDLNGVDALLGPRFALIGPGFVPSRPFADKVDHVLVTMGRIDAENATALALEALLEARQEGLKPRVTVALGSDFPHLDAVRALLPRFGGDADLVLDTNEMPTLLDEADMVIGAGGVGLQERVAKGVPSVTLILAANQESATIAAVEKGLTAFGRSAADTTREALRTALCDLAADRGARKQMAEKGPAAIDGKGPQRVARALCAMAHSAEININPKTGKAAQSCR